MPRASRRKSLENNKKQETVAEASLPATEQPAAANEPSKRKSTASALASATKRSRSAKQQPASLGLEASPMAFHDYLEQTVAYRFHLWMNLTWIMKP